MTENIIYFSSDEWEGCLKTSQYHIARDLAKHCKVLYVNSIGLRAPRASKGDFNKIRNKLKQWLRGIQSVDFNLFVITPIVLPFHRFHWVQILNRWLLIAFIKYCQFKLALTKPALITFLPNVVHLVGAFGEKKVIYYCADQMSSFKGVPQAVIKAMEEKLLRQADLVFATSRKLFEDKKKYNPNTHYLPHGVDFALFNQAQNPETKIPDDIARIKPPIIGFFGLISPDWIDYDLVEFLAEAHPEWSFVFIGKIDDEIPTAILQLKNIHFFGPKPYPELPFYLKAFNVAIVPFVKSELTHYCNPIKVKEYLAAGKPVVSVDLNQLHELNSVIEIGVDYHDYLARTEKALREDDPEKIESRINYVKNETWAGRVAVILRLMTK